MTEKDKNAQVIFESTLPHTEYSTRLIEERIWYCPARLTGNGTKNIPCACSTRPICVVGSKGLQKVAGGSGGRKT